MVSGDIPCKRANHKAVVVGKNMYVIGGWNGHGACDGVYMLAGHVRVVVPADNGTAPQARTGCEATLYKVQRAALICVCCARSRMQNHIICFGGKDSQKRAHNDLYALSLGTPAEPCRHAIGFLTYASQIR